MNDLFEGKLVRLCAIDPEGLRKSFSRWNRDSEFKRLLDFDPARLHSSKATKEWMKNNGYRNSDQ